MPDSIQNPAFGNTSLAQDVIEAYAEDIEGLAFDDCKNLGIDAPKCDVLKSALDRYERGEITQYERTNFEISGFSKEFIDTLAGEDGMKALNARIMWLGDNCVKKWWKPWISDDERREMEEELGYIGPAAKYAAPALVKVWEKEVYSFGYTNAETALGKIGIVSDEVTDGVMKIINNVIVPAMQDPDSIKRWWAYGKIQSLGPYSRFIIPQLIKGLKNETGDTMYRAMRALGNAGPEAQKALPVIIAILFRRTSDDVEPISLHYSGSGYEILSGDEKAAIIAIGEIGASEGDVSAIILKLYDTDSLIRYKAITALNQLKGSAFMAVPILDEMKDTDPDDGCRKAAAGALQRILDDTR